MIDEHLEVPFQTKVLGVDITVTGIDLGDDDQIVAICARERWRQRIRSSVCRCRHRHQAVRSGSRHTVIG